MKRMKNWMSALTLAAMTAACTTGHQPLKSGINLANLDTTALPA